MKAGEVKKGTIVLLRGHPCKVKDVQHSKPGKHGHAKAKMLGIDIFTGKKYEDISPNHQTVFAPRVFQTEFLLMSIDRDNFCHMICDDGTMRADVCAPREENLQAALAKDEADVFITTLSAMGQEIIISSRCIARDD